MITILAVNCNNLRLYAEAQHYFKRVIDSNAVPLDEVRFYLAMSYYDSGDFDKCRELIVPLYCKRIFDTQPSNMESLERKQGRCFLEVLSVVVSNLSSYYFSKGREFDGKGDELTTNGKPSGEC